MHPARSDCARRRFETCPAALIAFVPVLLLPTVTLAASPEFRGLGQYPAVGNYGSWLGGGSADGLTIVGGGGTPTGNQGFRWTWDTGFTWLGNLGNGYSSDASGCSGDGSVVASYSNPGGNFQATRWTQQTGQVGLGSVPNYTYQSYSEGISSDGNTIVGSAYNMSSTHVPFRWTAASGMVSLGSSGSALAVSSDGQVVVGYSGYDASSGIAFRWTQQGGRVALGDLPGGQTASGAYGVSADGNTVVGQSKSAQGNEAFRWTAASGMVGLGDLPGGTFESSANDASADGSIIVGNGISGTAPYYQGFIWDAVHGMRSVESVLQGLGVNLSGWSLRTCNYISDDGTVIAGYGLRPGGTAGEAWVARLPEPATLGLMAAAAGFFLRRPRHRVL